MARFDPSQMRVLGLDPSRHARVLGAPGTGKTTLVAECFARLIEQPGWSEESVLVLSPSRLAASRLRSAVERRAGRALGGTPVRTAVSLAFAVLARAAAVAGRDQPRLLTGTVQDEIVSEIVEQLLAGGADLGGGLAPEVLRSAPYRAELREMQRILDDFDATPQGLAAVLDEAGRRASAERHTRLPEPGLLSRWRAALEVVGIVSDRIARSRPDELSSSTLLRRAARTVREEGLLVSTADEADAPGGGALRMPRLVLVDDAQELGEGELALLAACADIGASIWAFGDPDIATGAFHGERTEALADLAGALRRRGSRPAAAGSGSAPEQFEVLEIAHRQRAELRGFVAELTARIGAAGAGRQRAATAGGGAVGDPDPQPAPVQFARASSPAEQLGIVAHRLRARRLGLDGAAPLPWSGMAVICRTRSEAARAARVLAGLQVPTGVAAGGLVLREHQIVRELIRLLQHALGIRQLTAGEVLQLVGGAVGGLDPVGIRRLRRELLLQERRDARSAERTAGDVSELVAEAFEHPGERPIVDSAGGRALRRLALLAARAGQVRANGGTARETMWAIWDGTGLAGRWQEEALDGRGARADDAHRSLDAVLGLFFALQRHEEQASEQPIAELLDELLVSAVPEDTLAARAERDAVTVTTPQGAVGREFSVVAVLGAQDGVWPNLRSRGSLLGTAALERWLRGGEALPPSRRDTLHDELRLFAEACARARDELLVVAVADEDQHPSVFFGFGRAHLVDGLPSSRLTLRGATADMRRRLASDPDDATALASLVALSAIEAPGARPDEWYGVLPPSTTAPIYDLEGDPELRVPVSPSQLERVETCPLDWVVSRLAGTRGGVQTAIGTLVHHAFETVAEPDPERLLEQVLSEWRKLPFEAEWESERAKRLAGAMTEGVAAYLREFDASDRRLLGRETTFVIEIGRAMLRGTADRLEARPRADGELEVTVLDLKTGRTPPTRRQTEEHAQLQSYQLGVVLGAFESVVETTSEPLANGGARLLYVHPDATRRSDFVERAQQPIGDGEIERLRQRVAAAADVMASGEFTARIEHHCSDPHQPGGCRIHIIPEVSNA